MRAGFARVAAILLFVPLALGAGFGHVEGYEAFSHGTQLFAPDHPNHLPFVPQHEHVCAACAVANVLPPASAPVFLAPPESGPSPETHADRAAPTPSVPTLSGRSPPSFA